MIGLQVSLSTFPAFRAYLTALPSNHTTSASGVFIRKEIRFRLIEGLAWIFRLKISGSHINFCFFMRTFGYYGLGSESRFSS